MNQFGRLLTGCTIWAQSRNFLKGERKRERKKKRERENVTRATKTVMQFFWSWN
jgi:hypothetical protein